MSARGGALAVVFAGVALTGAWPAPAAVPGASSGSGRSDAEGAASGGVVAEASALPVFRTGGLFPVRPGTGAAADATLVAVDPAPVSLAPGWAFGVLAADLDGDGLDELVRADVTTSGAAALVAVDGRTGHRRWSTPIGTSPSYVVAAPAAGGGHHLLHVTPASSGTSVVALDGATGLRRWSVALGPGTPGYFGVGTATTPSGPAPAALFGLWTATALDGDGTAPFRLTLQFRSVGDGALLGERSLAGTAPPTAVLTGDRDGDGSDDLYALEPVVPGAAAIVSAVTGLGRTVAARAPVVDATSDGQYLVAAVDVDGDGSDDPVVVSPWYDSAGDAEDRDRLTVLPAALGPGAAPLVDRELDMAIYGLSSPGDVDGDRGAELVVSGPVYRNGAAEQAVGFEAHGRGGRRWQHRVTVPGRPADLRARWWTAGGDLDADGTPDTLARVGDRSAWHAELALSNRDGRPLWEAAGTGTVLTVPAFVDLDGASGDDLVEGAVVERVAAARTVVSLAARRGTDRSRLWEHRRELTTGAPVLAGAVAGRFVTRDRGGVAVHHNALDVRYFAELLDGADGATVWTDPSTGG